MTQKLRSRGWCFTINNDDPNDLDEVLLLNCTYIVFGFEEGEEGTNHIQGYVHFANARTMIQVKTLLSRAHLEVARGSAHDNYKYCTKDGDFYEFGDIPSQGNRTDITAIKKLLDEGASMEDIQEEFPLDYIRYFKGFEKYRSNKNKFHRNDRIIEYVKNADVDHTLKNTIYVVEKSDLYSYDNEETIVIYSQKGFNTYAIELLSKGHPFICSAKVINPRKVIIVLNT